MYQLLEQSCPVLRHEYRLLYCLQHQYMNHHVFLLLQLQLNQQCLLSQKLYQNQVLDLLNAARCHALPQGHQGVAQHLATLREGGAHSGIERLRMAKRTPGMLAESQLDDR